ncbi:MAG: hypothetical protein PHR81_11035 [Bacteroidales bacterium]|jgi:hypothetical protein|nr:hypothetical protein [Bacteroidales bacterium]MDD4215336.1 hypothetical protein [Bacteroidales bacterium]
MFEKLRTYFLNNEIKNKLPKIVREKKLTHPDYAKTIGIIYTVGEENEYVAITNFVSRLQAGKKEVRTLGWVNYKNLPHYCYPRLMFDYVTKKNINWYQKPLGEKVVDFINKDFDILMNIDNSDNPSLAYAAALSAAKLKVGVFSETNRKFYDLMISLEEKPEPIVLAQQMLEQIAMLGSKQAAE